MTTKLGNLVENSIFTLGGVKYKVSTGAPRLKKDVHRLRTFLEEYDGGTLVVECYPFLGGQYQIHLSVFISLKQDVEIS